MAKIPNNVKTNLRKNKKDPKKVPSGKKTHQVQYNKRAKEDLGRETPFVCTCKLRTLPQFKSVLYGHLYWSVI